MNLAHLHLLLNHCPIIGTFFGLVLLVVSFGGKDHGIRRAAYIVFATVALLSLPTYFSGVGAQAVIDELPGVSSTLIDRHEGAAILALFFAQITGAVALVGLWQSRRALKFARWNVWAVVFFSLITGGLMTRVGLTGGYIRHPEIWPSQDVPAEARMGSIVHVFEPSPAKFAELMVANKFWWAFLMDVHFIGLAMLVGAVSVLDLRMLGFAKELPIAPLYRLVPWALGGFALNLTTGVLAFIGMPGLYASDIVFWYKMFAILLLGVNAAAFYLTETFNIVERAGPNEDAPPFAKLIAVSSLGLWIAVIALGRYIQQYTHTISSR